MKTTKRIFKEAHIIAKTFKGDYSACFAEALKMSWKNAKENFTPDFVKLELFPVDKTNVKSIFESLFGDFIGGKLNMQIEWNAFATEIFTVVKNNSKNFKKDIAERALMGNTISTKQKWCVAFEYKNLA